VKKLLFLVVLIGLGAFAYMKLHSGEEDHEFGA